MKRYTGGGTANPVNHIEQLSQMTQSDDSVRTGGYGMRQTRCIDCNAVGRITDRRAYNPGPRCDEHWREQKRKRSKAAHGKRIEKVYQITTAIYEFLYKWQGGVCYGCRKAKGQRRRLAVDHDHKKAAEVCGHDPNMGCPNCIRALLCAYCNEVMGRLDADALRRLADVHDDPPARRALAQMRAEMETGA